MSDEKKAFSRRLADAMRARGYDPKPGVLHKLFNSHYKGRSVAFSTASKWLRGLVLPEQDKLQVLATLFNMEPHVLRYGGKPRVGEGKPVWKLVVALNLASNCARDGGGKPRSRDTFANISCQPG